MLDRISKYIIFITALACVVYSVVLACKYMVNIPNADDYGIYLGFLNGVESNIPLEKKIGFAFGLQNEHRPLVERVVALVQYKITGRVNFIILMLIGNMAWVGVVLLFIRTLKIKVTSLSFLFLILLFFNLHHWENMYWATGALQNFLVLFFMLAAFAVCVKKTSKFGWALLLSGLAFYTSGNGLYAMVIVLGYVYIKASWKTKILGTLWIGLLGWLYFYNYATPSYLNSPGANLLHDPVGVVEYFISYLAGSFYLIGIHAKPIVLILGAGIFILSLLALLKAYKTQPFICMVILFCLFSIASASAARAQLGYIQALTPRYQAINAVLYFSVGYMLLKNVRVNVLGTASIAALVIPIFILSYTQNRKRISDYHTMYKRSAHCHRVDKPFSGYVYPVPIIAWAILVQSEQNGVYTMPGIKEVYPCD
jgi:hypothetical protein